MLILGQPSAEFFAPSLLVGNRVARMVGPCRIFALLLRRRLSPRTVQHQPGGLCWYIHYSLRSHHSALYYRKVLLPHRENTVRVQPRIVSISARRVHHNINKLCTSGRDVSQGTGTACMCGQNEVSLAQMGLGGGGGGFFNQRHGFGHVTACMFVHLFDLWSSLMTNAAKAPGRS